MTTSAMILALLLLLLPLPCADAFQYPSSAYTASSSSPNVPGGTTNRIKQRSSSSSSSSQLDASYFRTRQFGSFLKSTPNGEGDTNKEEIEKDGIVNMTMTNGDDSSTQTPTAQFGDVVRLGSISEGSQETESLFFAPPTPMASKPASASVTAEELAASRKKKNTFVAFAAVGLAFANYFYQFTHPLSTLQLLANMQQSHDPETTISLIGNNGKPTVVDFWAPWCENCRQMAPTLYQIQEQYGKDVNFVMVNGDDPSAWPLIEAFGVDAIPHMALVEADGTVDTALIGPVPKGWLDADLQVLIENGHKMTHSGNKDAAAEKLPYQMLDVFANRPEGARRLQISLKQ